MCPWCNGGFKREKNFSARYKNGTLWCILVAAIPSPNIIPHYLGYSWGDFCGYNHGYKPPYCKLKEVAYNCGFISCHIHFYWNCNSKWIPWFNIRSIHFGLNKEKDYLGKLEQDSGYPPVKCLHIAMENDNFLRGNQLLLWPFSIAFCLFTRPG